MLVELGERRRSDGSSYELRSDLCVLHFGKVVSTLGDGPTECDYRQKGMGNTTPTEIVGV